MHKYALCRLKHSQDERTTEHAAVCKNPNEAYDHVAEMYVAVYTPVWIYPDEVTENDKVTAKGMNPDNA